MVSYGISDHLRRSQLELEKLNSLREKAIMLSRKWLTTCRESILTARKLKELDDVERRLKAVINEVNGFLGECEGELGYTDPSIKRIISDSLQEAVEGIALSRLLRGEGIPSHEEIGVGPREYVLGIGDVVGELRRVALHFLLDSKIDEAERLAGIMEEIYEGLSIMMFPDSLVPVRRKADVARSLVEKTLSEILMAKTSGGAR